MKNYLVVNIINSTCECTEVKPELTNDTLIYGNFPTAAACRDFNLQLQPFILALISTTKIAYDCN